MTIHESADSDMTFNPDIDPKMWKAERDAYIETIKHLREVAKHATEKQAEYQSKYFKLQQDFNLVTATAKQILTEIQVKFNDMAAKH